MTREFGDYRFDPADGTLSYGESGEPLTVRPQVGRLLEAFIDQPGVVLDRESLYQAVWDENTVVDFESGLAALIRELRQSLERAGGSASLIETVPRRGYRLRIEPVDQAPASEKPPASVKAARTWRPTPFLSVVIASVLMVGVIFFARNGINGELPALQDEPAQPTLAILPFDVLDQGELSDEASRRLQLLIADGLLASLWQAQLEDLVLIGRAAIRPYEGRSDLAAAVAEDLNVDLLVEGSLTALNGDLWRVDARLLSMPGGQVLWSDNVEWDRSEQGSTSAPAEALVDTLAQAWPALFPELEADADLR